MNEVGPGFEIPMHNQPELPAKQSGEDMQNETPEERPAAQESGVGKRAPKPPAKSTTDLPVVHTAPAIPVKQDDQANPTPATSAATADLTADNGDLIEKEWIQRAKAILAKTQDDPHLQKTEMSKIKADYIQKRFNKIIKTDEPFDSTQSRPEQSRRGDAVTT